MRIAIALLLGALLVLPVVALGMTRATYAPLPAGDDDAPKQGGTPADDAKAKKEDKPVTTAKKYSRSGYDITPLSRERVAELAKKLDPEAYRVTQKAGTEPAFCGTLLDNKKDGVYCCVVCGLPLF